MKKIAPVLCVALLLSCSTEKHAASYAPRNATMRIVVADTSEAVEAVTGSVESLGGHVAVSEIWREGDLIRARLTLHVPRGSLTPALAAIRDVADRVERETVASEDLRHHCER